MQTHNHSLPLTPIAWVASDFKEKFATPRQPGLVPQARASVQFCPKFQADCVAGLDEFSHIWLLFGFHQTAACGWKPKVRPPRLGGNAKRGVFATRSPFRPNPLGLSLVALHSISTAPTLVLHIQGADLIDGTPIYDIKPYLPWVEAVADAQSGFAAVKPGLGIPVIFNEHALQGLSQAQQPDLQSLIEAVLLQDPRPAYQQHAANSTQRVYGCRLRQVNVQWQVLDNHILVTAITHMATTHVDTPAL